MIAPLYNDHQMPNSKPNDAHAGLWFERFFNRYETDWKIADNSKKDWINSVTGSQGNKDKLNQFIVNQQQLIDALQGDSRLYKTDWHFVTGMGNPHPVENGFTWHPTLAVPYLAGSAVKGLIRAWLELKKTEMVFNENVSEKRKQLYLDAINRRLKHWFGTADKKDIAEQTGDFIFFDAIPNKQPELICDIMTPHMGKWYEQGDTGSLSPDVIPADWHEPVPVPFLAVKNAQFLFSIAARKPNNKDHVKELSKIFAALDNALMWLGAGAKTAAGYGYMDYQEKATNELKQQRKKQAEQENSERELEEKLKNLSELAQTYFKQSDQQDWENDKNKFLQNSEIENWLTQLETTLDKDILTDLIRLLNKHIVGLLENPTKVQGKKNKPVYTDRQQKIAHRINKLSS